ncbi:hypothetical protein EV699_13910 [Plasticicumulans lactativorans]|uniref:CENP-V/GFA domain-containing protein n=1 Tax=Plasticicumulans lactativorans TaxID=1133106 RepID=A0A4R2KSM3_9GAMM|nr:GFA family protein [Plasticicumulans lactativorans]TCO75792.1 hypothetical protein EV699_13910 [Plasticicumulans lactativorans]
MSLLDTPLDGGCLCGRVRYRVDPGAVTVAYCHCTQCRRASGAPVSLWATVHPARWRLTRGALAWYAVGARAERGFCPHCGAQLVFRFTGQDEEIDVAVGTLDTPDALPPQYHVYTGTRLACMAALAPELPAWTDHGPDAPPPTDAA